MIKVRVKFEGVETTYYGRVQHLRKPGFKQGGSKGKGGITTVSLSVQGKVWTAFSVCRDNEMYNRKLGFHLCILRLFKKLKLDVKGITFGSNEVLVSLADKDRDLSVPLEPQIESLEKGQRHIIPPV